MDAALDKAARVFRERGFHATSVADLTEAMDLTSGSIYKAFKDKRGVFLAAFDHEAEVRREKYLRIDNAAGSGRERLRAALTFYAESSHGVEGKRGCFLVGCAAELSTFDADIAQRVRAGFQWCETLMAKVLRQGQEDGSILIEIDRKEIARMLLCLVQGMRLVGKTGRSRAEMTAIADVAMKLLG